MTSFKLTFDYDFDQSEEGLAHDIMLRASQILADRIETSFSKEIKGMALEKIAEGVEKVVDELMVKKIPVHDYYGEKTRKSTSIKEMLFEEAQKAFNQRQVTEIASRFICSDNFRKTVGSEIDSIKNQYEASLKEIISSSIEAFIKRNTK